MASKRTADGFKKASLAGGERQFKQTKLNFGSFTSSSSSSRAQQARQEPSSPSQDAASPEATPSPQRQVEGRQGAEGSQPKRKRTSPSRLDFSMEGSKENRPPSPSRPLQAQRSSSQQPQESHPSNSQNQPPGMANQTQQLIKITDIEGDLFSAPPNSVLIHACNAIGSWGGGIALAFKKFYPEAFKIYNAHCRRHSSDPRKLVGTALLIPPPAFIPSASIPIGGTNRKKTASTSSTNEARKQHWIGCVFTSKAYGKARDSPGDILRVTAPAMGHLMKLISVERTKRSKSGGSVPGEIRMCQINSGLFDVPWKETKRVLGQMTVDDALEEDTESKDDGGGVSQSELLIGLGELPVHIEAYWRQDLQK